MDVFAQLDIYRAHDMLDESSGLPIFPLNTGPCSATHAVESPSAYLKQLLCQCSMCSRADGVDIAGKNVFVENVTITNYDDTVCVKPLHGQDTLSSCAQDYTIRNCKVFFGVGMTIGSVPPNDNVNCVRNVTFENVRVDTPGMWRGRPAFPAIIFPCIYFDTSSRERSERDAPSLPALHA